MNNVNLGGGLGVEKLDADAVCAQCSTVNVEGTLLCKVCGNNLRDQRTRRLQADQAMDMEHTGQRRRAWVSGLLFILAIGLIVSTLVNQELIVDWLINVQSPAETSLSELWTGEYDAYFAPMMAELAQAEMDGERAAAALAEAPETTELAGIYALYDGETFLGTANFQLEEQEAYFVALLQDGAEVRGVARSESDQFIIMPDYAAMTGRRGQLLAISGVAIPQGNGAAECMGDNGFERASIMAFRLPDP